MALGASADAVALVLPLAPAPLLALAPASVPALALALAPGAVAGAAVVERSIGVSNV